MRRLTHFFLHLIVYSPNCSLPYFLEIQSSHWWNWENNSFFFVWILWYNSHPCWNLQHPRKESGERKFQRVFKASPKEFSLSLPHIPLCFDPPTVLRKVNRVKWMCVWVYYGLSKWNCALALPVAFLQLRRCHPPQCHLAEVEHIG